MTTPNIDAFNALLGVLVPFLVGFLSKRSWPSYVKGLLMLVISLLIAGVRTALDGSLILSNGDFVAAFFTIATAAQVTYTALTKQFAQALQDVGPIKDEQAPAITG